MLYLFFHSHFYSRLCVPLLSIMIHLYRRHYFCSYYYYYYIAFIYNKFDVTHTRTHMNTMILSTTCSIDDNNDSYTIIGEMNHWTIEKKKNKRNEKYVYKKLWK